MCQTTCWFCSIFAVPDKFCVVGEIDAVVSPFDKPKRGQIASLFCLHCKGLESTLSERSSRSYPSSLFFMKQLVSHQIQGVSTIKGGKVDILKDGLKYYMKEIVPIFLPFHEIV